MFRKDFLVAKEVAFLAGEYLNKQTQKHIENLTGRDIKLKLDKESETFIIKLLEKNTNYPILSEEIGLTKQLLEGKPYWIVDPIDGTLNFSRDNPSACVSIALWINKEPIFGVIYDFNRDELFSGIVNGGAWLNDKQITLSSIKNKNEAILSTGFPTYFDHNRENITEMIEIIQSYKKVRMIGSAALSLAYVATGRFDSYLEKNIKLWDIAAGVAINKALRNNIEIEYFDNYLTNIKVGI